MDLVSAIETFNATIEPKIELRGTFRDGHIEATLPRVGQTIRVKPGITGLSEPTTQDIAKLCQEVRRVIEPGMALLAAAIDALGELGASPGDDRPA